MDDFKNEGDLSNKANLKSEVNFNKENYLKNNDELKI